MTPRSVMAELFGRVDGCSKGKGGSMHLFDRNVNFLGGHGIVGGHVPIATGVAFAIKYRGAKQAIVCFMGEAAVNNGAFHESLNMAGLWKLPVIYIIENNKYGMGTAVERASSIKDMYKRGETYSIESAEVDGQDVLAVREAMGAALERARDDYLPDAARNPHLPLHGPLDVRRSQRNVPHENRTRGISAARSDHAARGQDESGAEKSRMPRSPIWRKKLPRWCRTHGISRMHRPSRRWKRCTRMCWLRRPLVEQRRKRLSVISCRLIGFLQTRTC